MVVIQFKSDLLSNTYFIQFNLEKLYAAAHKLYAAAHIW